MLESRLYYWEDTDGNLHSVYALGGFIGMEKITLKKEARKMLKVWREDEKKGEIELIKQKGAK